MCLLFQKQSKAGTGFYNIMQKDYINIQIDSRHVYTCTYNCVYFMFLLLH